MPLLTFSDRIQGTEYKYNVSQYAFERANRDVVYASNLFETLRAEEQEQHDAELAKELEGPPNSSSTTNPQPGCSSDLNNDDSTTSADALLSQSVSRWTRPQSLFLIETLPTLLVDYERSNKKKHQAYEDMAKQMKEKGYPFTVEQVKNKWLLLQRLYKQNLDLKGTSGEGKITWEFFKLMDDRLGKRRENDPVSTFSSTGAERKTKNTGGQWEEEDDDNEGKKETTATTKKRKSSALLDYLEAKKAEAEEREKAKQKRHEEKMRVKEAGIKILENILNKL